MTALLKNKVVIEYKTCLETLCLKNNCSFKTTPLKNNNNSFSFKKTPLKNNTNSDIFKKRNIHFIF